MTVLLGRDADLRRVQDRFGRHRLVTLLGPPGVGKTALARAVAQRWPGAVEWVDASTEVTATEGLLVLNDAEAVAGALADVVDGLLRQHPDLRVLVTSQVPLHVAGEVREPVSPLAQGAAAQLFSALIDRPDADPDTVAQICERLDGLPLALELAASAAQSLALPDLLAQLDERFALLDSGRGPDVRHASLWAALEASAALLSPEPLQLLRRLSRIEGPFSLAAARALSDQGGVLLAGLVERSLVVVEGDRYRMLESIRMHGSRTGDDEVAGLLVAFAEALLRPGPDEPVWVRRVTADWSTVEAALGVALEAPALLQRILAVARHLGRWWTLTGRLAEGRVWSDRLRAAAPDDEELAVVAAGVLIAAGDLAAADVALRQAAPGPARDWGLARLATQRGEGELAAALLDGLDAGDDAHLRLAVLVAQATNAQRMGRYDDLATLAARTEVEAAALGNASWMARAAMLRHYRHRLAGDLGPARAAAEVALELAVEGEDRTTEAVALGLLGGLEIETGDHGAGLAFLDRSLAITRAGGDPRVTMVTAFNAAETRRRQGDAAGARRGFGETLGFARRIGDRRAVGWTLTNLADLNRVEGDLVASRSLLREALTISWAVLDRRNVIQTLESTALVVEPEEARDLASACDAVRAELGLVRDEGYSPELERVPRRPQEPRTLEALVSHGLQLLGVPPAPGEPAPVAPRAQVEVRTLGGFALAVDGAPVDRRAWQSKKARDLLKVLAVHRGHPVTRDVLAEVLWPGADPGVTSARLSVALSTLRAVLGPARDAVLADRSGVALDLGAIWLDLAALHDRAAAGDHAGVLELYLGDLLPEDLFEEWSVAAREEARAVHAAAARATAQSASARGAFEDAARCWRRVLEQDVYDEAAHRGLVVALGGLGAHGEARRAYATYADRMTEIGLRVPDIGAFALQRGTGHQG